MKILCKDSVELAGMKQILLVAGSLAFLGGFALTGCVEPAPPPPPPVVSQPAPVIVAQAPPAPAQEVVVASPGVGYVWVPGYWSWQGRWVRVSGAWVARPHAHAVWVPGYWAHRPHGYVWIGGHWR